MNRRKVLKKSGIGLLGLTTLGQIPSYAYKTNAAVVKSTRKINVFSKHLQWVGYEEMAKITSDIGFDGLDLTVRPKGHVEPEKVERDLPRAIEACDKHGLKTEMITTAIKSVDDPTTEKILKTASGLGVKVYRTGWYKYDYSISIPENIKKFGVELKKIGELNAKYNIMGDYQNHSGTSGGAPVWDIYQMLEAAKSSHIGVQYDIRHAMVEGLKSWPLGLRLLAKNIHSIDIKDYEYVKTDKGWDIRNVPLGQGAVDFKSYFELLDELKIEAPISIHLEYPLGGADHGKFEITIPRKQVIDAMAKDLKYLKSVM
jgi:L-ribulose-5-phosphate 3-epimerase